jgi:uncharacterized protein YegP (UPF0339 family)
LLQILQSEGYKDKTGMITGVNAVRERGASEANFDSKTAVDSSPYFVLKAANGETIGRSETYSSLAAKDNGIQAVKTAVTTKPAIQQIDLTENGVDGAFELFVDVKGEYRFRLRSPNGQIVLASEGYKQKAGALNGIASVRENAPTYARFVLKDPSADDQYWFVLRAANNEIIGVSEMYKAAGGRAYGIYAVQRLAGGAKLLDFTVVAAATPATPKLELFQQGYGTFAFQLRDSAGRVIFTSFAYKDAAAAKSAASKFKADAATLSWGSAATSYGAVAPAYGAALLSGYDFATFTAAVRTALATAVVDDLSSAPARRGRFTMFCGKTTGVYFNLKAANGEIILQSEKYNSRTSAKKGIASVQTNVKLPATDADTGIAPGFKQLIAKDQSPYFTLQATNGRIIGVSETYSSAAARDNGIWSVTRNAPGAIIVDDAFGCKLKEEPRYPSGFDYLAANKVFREEELAAEQATDTAAASSVQMIGAALVAVVGLFAL